eukprot:GFUD01009551.1.p1 GENE.GFUD01009551.1~~GFUD01009551.1.p1  ORF type:complete len:327 (+),score=53.25 GFUD01009551.1:57-1037(+)
MDDCSKVKMLALAAKKQHPGLTSEKLKHIMKRVKNTNNGTLIGLKVPAFLGLVKKEIHDKWKEDEEKWKQEKREENVTCPICYIMLSDRSARDRHLKAKHNKSVMKVTGKASRTGFDKKCPKCERYFKYEFSLEYHVERFHGGENERLKNSPENSSYFNCEICDNVFKHYASLKRHMKVHNETESFKCTRCDASFNRKDNLIKHEKRIHSLAKLNVDLIRKNKTGEYICKICGRNFGNDRIKFEAHLIVKSCQQTKEDANVELDDNLRFPCDQCDKTYAEKDYLSRHIRWKHSGRIDPFICTECEASFKLKSSLVRHRHQAHDSNI